MDLGIGIPESEHKKIFECFYRTKDKNSVISGFGPGLYICSQIIKDTMEQYEYKVQEMGLPFIFTTCWKNGLIALPEY